MKNAMDPKYEYEVAAAVYPDPLALFERDPDWKPPFWQNHGLTASSAFSLGLTRVCGLYWQRRPIYSGIQRTALWILGGAIAGYIGRQVIDRYVDFRSQVHRHYMQLHPERFPPPPKVKIGDKFELWMPSRQ